MSGARILIVEDDIITSMDLKRRLLRLNYQVLGVLTRGEDVLIQFDTLKPDIILMDIMLEGAIDGIDTASQLHQKGDVPIIFLTTLVDNDTFERAKITEPFAYIIKPTLDRELQINIEIALYKARIDKERNLLLKQLQEQQDKINELSGLIPICSSCKKIRDDEGYWHQVEEYIRLHSKAEFTHSLCPSCLKSLYPDLVD